MSDDLAVVDYYWWINDLSMLRIDLSRKILKGQGRTS